MKYFTRKALIDLGTDKISFSISNLQNDAEESFFDCSFFEIKSYNVQFPNRRFACLILNFNSGAKKELSFLRQSFNDSQTDTDSVIESIHLSFRNFNSLQKETQRIEYAPSFYASKRGLYTIVALTLFLFVGLGIAIGLDKNIPLTFLMSVLLIGQLISRRASDLAFYKKMKEE